MGLGITIVNDPEGLPGHAGEDAGIAGRRDQVPDREQRGRVNVPRVRAIGRWRASVAEGLGCLVLYQS